MKRLLNALRHWRFRPIDQYPCTSYAWHNHLVERHLRSLSGD